MTNEELRSHIKAIAEWAGENNERRSAFVVCCECDDNGCMEQFGSLMGTAGLTALSICCMADKQKEFGEIVRLAAMMMQSDTLMSEVVKRIRDSLYKKSEDKFDFALDSLLEKFKDLFGKK